MNVREYALEVAERAHRGQTDKGGEPYINHPVTVAENFVGDDLRYSTALLHDVVEDTNITAEDLKNYGFPIEIINAVEAITKIKGEEYENYLKRVKSNPIACDVKIADIKHNSQLSRLKEITPKDYTRVEKYKKALDFLES